MCEAHRSGSAGVASVTEPLLVSLGGSGQAWWTPEGWGGCFLQNVPVMHPKLWWKGCDKESCPSWWEEELSCLAWSLWSRRPQAGKYGCCRGGWCSCLF